MHKMSAPFLNHLVRQLEDIRSAGLYKSERVIDTPRGTLIRLADSRQVLDLCAIPKWLLRRSVAGLRAFQRSLHLRDADARGGYVVGFSYPVLPQGKARIRTQISAAHSREDLEFAVGKFAEVKQALGL